MNRLDNTTVLVLGLGESGLAMARWCAAAGAKVRVWDSRDDANLGAGCGAPARHRQARFAEAEHQHDGVASDVHQRSFKLARPTRHSSMVMIQKRTTTCDSFHPDFSK